MAIPIVRNPASKQWLAPADVVRPHYRSNSATIDDDTIRNALDQEITALDGTAELVQRLIDEDEN